MQSSFTALKALCALSIQPSQPLTATDCFTVFLVLPFGITEYVALSDWLLSLSDRNLRFFHVFSWLDSLFIFSAVHYFTV